MKEAVKWRLYLWTRKLITVIRWVNGRKPAPKLVLRFFRWTQE